MTASHGTTHWLGLMASPGKKPILVRAMRAATRAYLRFRTRHAPEYVPPSEPELEWIEQRLAGLGIVAESLRIEPVEFDAFIERFEFPSDYYGDRGFELHREKMLEHFLAWKLLDLDANRTGSYVDVAACASPWAHLLREQGVEAYAIDLEISASFSNLAYYRQEDATKSSFPTGSVGAASLQCAFEMFAGDHDQALVVEMSRILEPGGRVVISPLYMHTHPCHYQTPEHFGFTAGDPGARGYVRRDAWGVITSRKYSPETLLSRIWNPAVSLGLRPRLLVLRNKREIGPAIYLHFILMLEKPGEATQ